MEDASKEFQIFLSPVRDRQISYNDNSRGKHRIVPVINKILSTSSATFTINQRKSSVYKAVSGVSFQETTDVKEKNSNYKKQKKKKERRKSYASTTLGCDKSQENVETPSGARRSRSLTSMESGRTTISDPTKHTPEIVHPFAPVILHNQSSGRKSRYSRIKEKRRSSSQARHKTEYIKYENGDLVLEHEQPPVRPRRTRSASRPRNSITISPFFSEKDCDSTLHAKDDFPFPKYERKYSKQTSIKNTQVNDTYLHKNINISSADSRICKSFENIDFSVNDSDWRKYDEVVTKKLATLLKAKEEPEGGYFSLEREETEEINVLLEDGDHFERENSSETIYVAQGILTGEEDALQPRNDQYTVEEIYSEVPYSHESTEVGFIDDEGLYEEIFYDKTKEHNKASNDVEFNKQNLPINIRISSKEYSVQSKLNDFEQNINHDLKKNSSTVVYIGECKPDDNIPYEFPSVHPNFMKQSASCSNLLNGHLNNNTNKSKSVFHIDINRNLNDSTDICATKNSPWCGCSTGFSTNHSFACIRSMSGLLSTKQSLLISNAANASANTGGLQAVNEALFPKDNIDGGNEIRLFCTDNSHPNKTYDNRDFELSDIDLDMFTPKDINTNVSNPFRSHQNEFVSKLPLNLQINGMFRSPHFKIENRERKKTYYSNKQNYDYVSPKTFEGFLHDSIFNPPDTDSSVEETEGLIIRSDQIISCISDSSSDQEESNDEISACVMASPWLEAKNDFEYVTFKEEKNEKLNTEKRKPPRKIASVPNLLSNLQLSVYMKNALNNSNDNQWNSNSKDDVEIPTRPSRGRRRKTAESNKADKLS